LIKKKKKEFILKGKALINQTYDIFRVYNYVLRLFLFHYCDITFSMSHQNKVNLVCTDILFSILNKISPMFKNKIKNMELDLNKFGSVSIEDFFVEILFYPTFLIKLYIKI